MRPPTPRYLLRYLIKSLLCIVCLWLAVGPLAILQLGAWSWMIVSYSQESNIEQAIRETFSDERPCGMCCLIDAVEKETDSTGTPPPSKKKDQSLKLMLGLSRAIVVLKPHSENAVTPFNAWHFQSLSHPVPTPPPRSRA